MSISDAIYNNMLEEKKQAILRSEYKSIRACPLKEVNGRVDNYTAVSYTHLTLPTKLEV